MKTTTAENNPDIDSLATTNTLLQPQGPGYRQQDGNHVLATHNKMAIKVQATNKMAIMSWLQTTRWQSCPG